MSDLAVRQSQRWRRIYQHRWHYLFLLPMVVTFFAFTAWPILASWWYALYDWSGFGPVENFVGLANFVEVFEDPLFWNAFRHSAAFALFGVVVQVPIALVIAVLLNSTALRGRNVYRTLLFLPVVTATAVVGLVFVTLLNPSGGPINELFLQSGLMNEPVNFLGAEPLALPTILVIDLWKNIGTTIIYWLAALQTIPAELYEAARIDGAGTHQIFTRITLPLVAPIGIVIVLLTFVASLNAFDVVQTMTQGGPNGATDIVQTYIFRYAFDPAGTPRFGFASAAGILFGVAVMVVTVLPLLLRRARVRAMGPFGGH